MLSRVMCCNVKKNAFQKSDMCDSYHQYIPDAYIIYRTMKQVYCKCSERSVMQNQNITLIVVWGNERSFWKAVSHWYTYYLLNGLCT